MTIICWFHILKSQLIIIITNVHLVNSSPNEAVDTILIARVKTMRCDMLGMNIRIVKPESYSWFHHFLGCIFLGKSLNQPELHFFF